METSAQRIFLLDKFLKTLVSKAGWNGLIYLISLNQLLEAKEQLFLANNHSVKHWKTL